VKLGFENEYRLYRMTHPSVPRISPGDPSIEPVNMQVGDLPEVAAFDRQVFGADRTDLILHLYQSFPELAWLIREEDRVAGFCLGRPGQNFTQLGPVSARSAKHAEALMGSAFSQITGRAVVVDIPSDKSHTRLRLEASGFLTQRPFDRMFLHSNPHPGSTSRVYLIAGPELG
jgi:hypothetical protein